MKTKITYEVWTVHEDGELGVKLYWGTWRECNTYIRQAIKKGAKIDSFALLLSDSDIKKKLGRG